MKPRKTKTRADQQAEQAVGRNDIAPPRDVPENPSSILSKTSTYYEELTALNAITFDLVDLDDLEQRIGLRARIIIEYVMSLDHAELKMHGMSMKDKVDLALRSISTLEGSKQEVTWRETMAKKPRRVSVAALKREREQVEERLHKVLSRRAEVKKATAEDALNQLRGKPTNGEN